MCGIAGFIDPHGLRNGEEMTAVARRMADSLAHRGPDDSGEWCDDQSGVALGHRRLSIIDRSSQGHQPMASESGRFVITYNGEIYNFRQLAEEAARDGARFRGSSDTEVLLATVERRGVPAALSKLVGMFAFALWDRQERALYLARDRIGEKPLYFGWAGKGLLFASEMKALHCYPGWRGEVNRSALEDLLRQGYIRAPLSIYTDVYKLPPGTFLKITAREAGAPGEFSPEPRGDAEGFHPVPYWSLREVIEGVEERTGIDEAAAGDELQRRLEEAVRGQMISDVPLGALLSGGIDSSLVVAVMQSQASAPVRTFTIGFTEADFNEAGHAKAVARHLGTDHTEFYVTATEAREVIPRLPEVYDEPFADSSQIPTYLVSKLAREHVTVALSGDAGDELFGGYTRYAISDRLWSRLQAIPAPLKAVLGPALAYCPEQVASALMKRAGRAVSDQIRVRGGADQLQRIRELLAVREFSCFYESMIAHWKAPELVVRGGSTPAPRPAGGGLPHGARNAYDRMMFVDTLRYLPDDILTKVDRASMAVSLEVRVPLLDHRLVEWAWGLPFELKVRNGKGKHLLRKVLSRYVPDALIDRPKMGFGVPIDAWLRGPLRDWAEDLLSEDRLRREGYFHPGPIRSMWDAHLKGEGDWHYYLWDVLMFQAWLHAWHASGA